MHHSLFIAWRYFFARRNKSVVNIISRISLIGISVCAFALIVVLSVYNGIGQLTQSLFNVFDPQLLVEPSAGKCFRMDSVTFGQLKSLEGVAEVTPIVEEKAWVTYGQYQSIVDLRGVDASYARQTGIDTLIYNGRWIFGPGDGVAEYGGATMSDNGMVVGAEVYYRLGLSRFSNMPLSVYIPKRTTGFAFSMNDAFNQEVAVPMGYFVVQQDVDSRYALCNIQLVRHLLDYADDEFTSLAIALDAGADPDKVKARVEACLSASSRTDGNGEAAFSVKDRFEQQPLYFKIFRSERLAIYMILALITFISTFTLIASTALLIIDKRHDSMLLRAVGMETNSIRKVFFLQGLFIAVFGTLAGLAVGFVVCFVQQQYGIVPMGDNFVTRAFPVAMQAQDFFFTFLLVVGISAVSVWFTTRRCEV